MAIRFRTWAAAGILLAFTTLATASAATGSPASSQAPVDATDRLIIKLRDTAVATTAASQRQAQSAGLARSHASRARRLAERSGLPVRGARDISPSVVALSLHTTLSGDNLDATLATLRANPDVVFAEVDQRRSVRAVPDDPLYASQWYLQSTETAATNFEDAWETTTGGAGTVIAVLDTGIRYEHPDLTARALDGYDFVSGESSTSFASANDGDDWDDDASDPGDWVSAVDSGSGPLRGCEESRSSWHGTRVAAMIGAGTNNATGIAGGTWAGQVLPVRVLGKCGGYDSDIVAGMRWAAGLPVAGVPANPTPARVLNLSLGGPGTCSSTYRDAIADLTEAGVLVVASAGNDSGPVEAPANCAGVLAVGGIRHVGTKVGYSSLGAEVGIAAPAGNCPDVNTTFLCGFSLITADNDGLTVPGSSSYTDDSNYNIGTSFSAPIVAAVAGLMVAVNDDLTGAEIIARIKSGSRPFPAADPSIPTCPQLDSVTLQCNCTTTTCGAGIADAPGAIAEALRPAARIVAPTGNGAGQDVTLDGSDSTAAPGRTISAYAWTPVSGSPAFVGPTNGPDATVTVPASGLVTVQLAVTDDAGRQDAREVTLGKKPGGGGGAVHPLVLAALVLLASRRRRAQR